MIRALAGLAGLIVVAGAFGALAGPLDALALLRVPAAVVLAVCALAWPLWVRGLAWAVAGLALASWAVGLLPGPAGTDLRLYQKNVFYRNQAPDALIADILASDADVVTLQELSTQSRPIRTTLAETYPNTHACMYRGWEVAVLSRLPFTSAPQICSAGRGMAVAEVVTAAGPVWVASVHDPWPWPHAGWERGRELAALIASLNGTIVVAGDFNTVPWSNTVRRMAQAAGGKVLGAARGSIRIDGWRAFQGNDMTGAFDPALSWWAVPLAIDHVIAPGGRRVLRPLLGSDHHGLLAEISLTQ